MPVWKLHRKRRFDLLPEPSPPPFAHPSSTTLEKKHAHPLPRPASPSTRAKLSKPAAPVGPGTLYWRRRARRAALAKQADIRSPSPSSSPPRLPELPPSPELSDCDLFCPPPSARRTYRARFIDLDELFSQFPTPSSRAAEGAASWFRFQAQLAAQTLILDLSIWVRHDCTAAEHAARMWREDLQRWVDGFEEWELGGEMYWEVVRVAGELPRVRRCPGEGNRGKLCPNDVDPTEGSGSGSERGSSRSSEEEDLLETPPFTLYPGSGSD